MAAIPAAVAQVSRVEPEAEFAELFAQYRLRAYYYALKMLGNPDDALEVAQEAFLRLHRHWVRRDRSRPFAPWMYSVVRNLSIDLLRKRACRQECELEAAPEVAPEVGPERGPSDASSPSDSGARSRGCPRRNAKSCCCVTGTASLMLRSPRPPGPV